MEVKDDYNILSDLNEIDVHRLWCLVSLTIWNHAMQSLSFY